jgi:hypothetical protein
VRRKIQGVSLQRIKVSLLDIKETAIKRAFITSYTQGMVATKNEKLTE